MRLTVGTEVVKRHIFKATLQQWGMMSGWVCKCKLLCTVNVECEGWQGSAPTTITAIMMQQWKASAGTFSLSALFFLHSHQKMCYTSICRATVIRRPVQPQYVAAATTGCTTCPDGLNQWASALVVCAASDCHQSQTNTVQWKGYFPSNGGTKTKA